MPELLAAAETPWRVVCLCAEWCGTCRAYREGFERLAGDFPALSFIWLDVDDASHPWSDWMADLPVEDFPTLLVQRGEQVLHFGALLPQAAALERMLASFLAQTPAESEAWAHSSELRLRWQESCRLPA